MFDTDFFAFRMTHSDASVENLIRVEHYSVPRELDKHLASVFNTIEMFDQIFKHVQSIYRTYTKNVDQKATEK